MRIAVWTVVTLWTVVATWWVDAHVERPWWVGIGLGFGIGGALYVLITSIRETRPPKPPKKPFPTTPR